MAKIHFLTAEGTMSCGRAQGAYSASWAEVTCNSCHRASGQTHAALAVEVPAVVDPAPQADPEVEAPAVVDPVPEVDPVDLGSQFPATTSSHTLRRSRRAQIHPPTPEPPISNRASRPMDYSTQGTRPAPDLAQKQMLPPKPTSSPKDRPRRMTYGGVVVVKGSD